MKIAALLSGGKDSVYAIYITKQYGWDVTHLVTIYPRKQDSWMFHSVNIHATKLIATSLEIPHITEETTGEKEEELEDLKHLLEDLDIDGVISGAIASEYQRTRIEKICHELGLKSFTPIWHKNQTELLKEQVNAGFKIIIVGVFAQGFDETWLGKTLTVETIEALSHLEKTCHINTAGEGGEFETLVIDGPLFKKEIVIEKTQKLWKRDTGILKIMSMHLENHS